MKPRIVCKDFETTELRDFSQRVIRVVTIQRWLVSCPCNPRRALAIATTHESALEIALLHGRTFHA